MHRRTQHKDELKYKCIFAKWGMAFEDKQTLKSHIEGMHSNYMNLSKNLEEKELCYNDKVTQIWSGIRHKNVLDTLFSTEEIYSTVSSKKSERGDTENDRLDETFVSSKDLRARSYIGNQKRIMITFEDEENNMPINNCAASTNQKYSINGEISSQSNVLPKESQENKNIEQKSENLVRIPVNIDEENFQQSKFSDLNSNIIQNTTSEKMDDRRSAFIKHSKLEDEFTFNEWSDSHQDQTILYNWDEFSAQQKSNDIVAQNLLSIDEYSDDNEESSNIICIKLDNFKDWDSEVDFNTDNLPQVYGEPKRYLYTPIPINRVNKIYQSTQTDNFDSNTTNAQIQWDSYNTIPDDTMKVIRGMFIDFMKVYLANNDPNLPSFIESCINYSYTN